MNKLIFGFDLGTASIGWVAVNDGKSINGAGVRIFPEGVNRNKKNQKESSLNSERRIKRQIRKQLYRRRKRKSELARVLMKYNMFPQMINLDSELKQVILNKELQTFFSINPYSCRAKAVQDIPIQLTPYELGRVLYHFSQRRGYRSNLLADTDDKETGALFSGKPEEGKTGIISTREGIEKFKTLGSFLNQLNPHSERIRNRYTERQMFIDEFNEVWETQSKFDFWKNILTNELKNQIANDILFFQRPLKSQKGLVGKCRFEPGKPRCPISSPEFELYRIWKTINSIKNGTISLDEKQRKAAFDFMVSKDKFKFGDLAKKLGTDVSQANFNYDNEQVLPGSNTLSKMRLAIGKKQWEEFTPEKIRMLWHDKYNATDKNWLKARLIKNYSLNEEQADKLLNFRLQQGYSGISTKVIRAALPYLEKGFAENEAILIAGISNCFGVRWQDMGAKEQNYIIDSSLDLLKQKSERTLPALREWFGKEFSLTEKELKKLYHHSDEENLNGEEKMRSPIVDKALTELQFLVNAMVVKYGKPDEIRIELSRDIKSSKEKRENTLIEQRRKETENNLIKKELDGLNLPHTAGRILKLKLYREIERKAGNVRCPYTGKSISISQLFSGEVNIEHIIPASRLPGMQLDNLTLCFVDENRAKSNKTPFEYYSSNPVLWEEIKNNAYHLLPYRKYIRFISDNHPELDDFINRQLNETRYISRKARARLQKQFPEIRVNVTQGATTAMLRHYWGLDSILQPNYQIGVLPDGEYLAVFDEKNVLVEAQRWNYDKLKDIEKALEKKGMIVYGNVVKGVFKPYKTRDDHRHHAIDALTIACTKVAYVQKIAEFESNDIKDYEKQIQFPQPWPSFWQDAKKAVSEILVSHKKRNKILTKSIVKRKVKGKLVIGEGLAARDQLHNDTFYGQYKDRSGKNYYHYRKPLNQITESAQVNKIVDEHVRKAVIEAILKADPGINIKEKYKVPNGAFFQKTESGRFTPLVFLPNKNGEPVPVKKVRIRDVMNNVVKIDEKINKWVDPDNNHHALIYQTYDGQLNESVVTFWEVVERKREKTSVYQMPPDGKKIIATLQSNDLFLLGIENTAIELSDQKTLCNHLYRVQKISHGDYNFRHHTASHLNDDRLLHRVRSASKLLALNPVKVIVDRLGTIKKATK
ncbi:MAG: type II CRISPR RNA-guided endonuclease Cas9 [Bacteroidia bacterium]|jgi:CRISPR-associated endonuclease Csn1|nr:type II CRISPR RNA-guided endonuclease Cas9 [Bacteroidia bacterium]